MAESLLGLTTVGAVAGDSFVYVTCVGRPAPPPHNRACLHTCAGVCVWLCVARAPACLGRRRGSGRERIISACGGVDWRRAGVVCLLGSAAQLWLALVS